MINKEEQFIKDFGANLRKLRNEKNLTQAFLADLAGIHRSQIMRIESGEVNTTLSTLKQIADALQIPVSELFEKDS
ncbi:MAG: helix-turn-helix transcriptional regulator [Fulvivirga sp.]|uniref:helix-turn-helix domain-containing protein n=1 Tax=Fulvivirga sp. TaxID=1931237 RepID=UPI0032EC7E0D